MSDLIQNLTAYAMQLGEKYRKGAISIKDVNKFQVKLQQWYANSEEYKAEYKKEEVEDKTLWEDTGMSIEEIVKDFISDFCFRENVKKAHDLREDLKMDESDIEDLASEIEYEFDIEIGEDDIEKWETVKDVIAYVKKNTGGLDE